MRKILAQTTLALALSFGMGACKAKTASTGDTPAPSKTEVAAPVSLSDVLAHPRRAKEAERDKFRNPKPTLEFFEVGPGKNVVEIWPGWYTNAIAPYLAENNGTYTAALYHESQGERAMKRVEAFKAKYADTDVYGNINYAAFSKDSGLTIAPNSADVILTFRNVHNWMGSGYAEEAFATFYDGLKPGGILGVVEHRLPETMAQDPRGATGYVQESYMKSLAKAAGFEFVGSSEVNANPKDTADHPFGVWTLPPSSRTPKEGSPEASDFDAAAYKNIGESDRATLKFRKPG